MKFIIAVVLSSLIAGCSWFEPPRGTNSVTGSFIYYDFDPSSFGEKESINYLFKAQNKSFIGAVPTKQLISTFYDHQKAIPFEGIFEGIIIYDKMGRVDSFQIKSLDSQKANFEIKAKDHN